MSAAEKSRVKGAGSGSKVAEEVTGLDPTCNATQSGSQAGFDAGAAGEFKQVVLEGGGAVLGAEGVATLGGQGQRDAESLPGCVNVDAACVVVHGSPDQVKAAEIMGAALTVDELRADAALHGETVQQAAIRRCRDVCEAAARRRGRGGLGGEQWRRMAPELRQVLVAMATDRRDPESAALLPWDQLTPDERIAIGSTARDWKRQLEGAGWLR